MSTSARPIVTARCMDYDDNLWEKSDKIFEAWRSKLFERDVLRKIGNFIHKHRRGVPEELFAPKRGAFNGWLRMLFEDGASAVIRFPIPGASMFPEEKLKREVAVMQFLEFFTGLRLPHVLHYGMTEESPMEQAPFIIMEYISNEGSFSSSLNIPGRSVDDRPMLDPDVSQERLELVYSQMADVLLQVSKHAFEAIGCIGKANEEDEFDDTWVVKHRPLTYNMNELVQLGGVSPEQLPKHTFKTASSYYQALAETHLIHLSSQQNDAIDSIQDYRQKYIARCLFRKITREHQFDDDSGPFKLTCDDLRPANVVRNESHQMTGVLDWEFTYAAPTGFAYSPPFWLLLELPESWEEGLDDWTQRYEKVLPTFLKVLKEREEAAIDRGTLKETDRLSEHMLESWDTGDFWLNYAAKKSWGFDMVYWAKIDRRFFGDGDLEDRLQLLTPEERQQMDAFIEGELKARLPKESSEQNPVDN